MFHRWAALLLVLALCAMTPKNAAGQSQQPPRGQSARGFKNYPNPFNPETNYTLPIGPDGCNDLGRQYVVSVYVYNVLMQPVATPVLKGASPLATTPIPPGLQGRPISNLKLSCGIYEGYWSGKLENGREAPSGVYIARLIVDGKVAATLKSFLSK